ncbi:extracellular serine/threonine protein kinase four-jointed-like [Limulus polyphemus]|uniref:Extracellular serine/threonine protein kinase four-jointed-like n=1 Tax=Limulus polyphemus TaxID=6850 RepID=A0ABM1B6N7_LIMPO|nr:extracellular serine/threonine protein kinase four-jointed-like [Limulus polyphemus]
MNNCPRSHKESFGLLSHRLCLTSAGIAFTVGMLCGVLLPVYLSGSSSTPGFFTSRGRDYKKQVTDKEWQDVEPITQSLSVTQASVIVVVPRPDEKEGMLNVHQFLNSEKPDDSLERTKEGHTLKDEMLHLLKTGRVALTNGFQQKGQVAENGKEILIANSVIPSHYLVRIDSSKISHKNENRSNYFLTTKLNLKNSGAKNLSFNKGFNETAVGVENNEMTGLLPAESRLVPESLATTTFHPKPSLRWLPTAKRNLPGRAKYVGRLLTSGVNLGSNNIDDISSTQPSTSVTPFSLRSQKNYAGPDPKVITNIVNGIYWAEELEKNIPDGFIKDMDNWRQFVNKTKIVKISEGCGRMQNRLITFENGNNSCCRYRQNNDQIQGEIFSFYLSRLLNIGNLPPSVLAVIRGQERQWERVHSQLYLAQWNVERPVVLTKFVDDLEPAYIPPAFRTKDRRLHPVAEDLSNKTMDELIELAQWSDLIIFDYLTANLDRMVNNMFNEQWNSEMMNSPTHNLAKHKESGLLIFFDNESGLLHGYRLLDKYEHFHRYLINSLCVFRKKTADSVVRIHRTKNIAKLLKQAFINYDPGMSDWLPFLPEHSIKTLKHRIQIVYDQIQQCRVRYNTKVDLEQTNIER